jgi:hypothetical protein
VKGRMVDFIKLPIQPDFLSSPASLNNILDISGKNSVRLAGNFFPGITL